MRTLCAAKRDSFWNWTNKLRMDAKFGVKKKNWQLPGKGINCVAEAAIFLRNHFWPLWSRDAPSLGKISGIR
jgi:hypothetical protein